MTVISNLTVAILAGGCSTRFGYPKMFAQYGHQTFIDYCLQFGYKLSESVLVMIGNHPKSKFNNTRCFQDVYPHHGPLGGIYSALKYSPTEYIAIVPCDMPFLSPDIYQILYQNRNTLRPLTVKVKNQIHPLVSLWPKALSRSIEYYFEHNNNCVCEALKNLEGLAVPIIANEAMFLNMNTQNDYKTFKFRASLHPYEFQL
ncbi:MAG: molybdenum cofactor guanylyltransferase [bacterium]|nr:MAG: molybdenum cofactor guanylyltransferase [bacterium]